MVTETKQFCHQCGSEIIPGDSFCQDCGAKALNLADAVAPKVSQPPQTTTTFAKQKINISLGPLKYFLLVAGLVLTAFMAYPLLANGGKTKILAKLKHDGIQNLDKAKIIPLKKSLFEDARHDGDDESNLDMGRLTRAEYKWLLHHTIIVRVNFPRYGPIDFMAFDSKPPKSDLSKSPTLFKPLLIAYGNSYDRSDIEIEEYNKRNIIPLRH